jgi:limonene-1,2-epoxide hydrolase
MKNYLFLVAFAAAVLVSCNNQPPKTEEAPKEDPVKKSIDNYKKFVDLITSGKADEAAPMLAADAVEHPLGWPELKGRDSIIAMIKMWSASTTNPKMELLQVTSDGEYVFSHYRSTGTAAPNAMGTKMKGGPYDYTGIEIVKYNKEGLATDHWDYPDMMAYSKQVGLSMEPPKEEKKK